MTKIVVSEMLRCGKCFELKNIETDNFGTSKTSKSGYRSYCRSCENVASKVSKSKTKQNVQDVKTMIAEVLTNLYEKDHKEIEIALQTIIASA